MSQSPRRALAAVAALAVVGAVAAAGAGVARAGTAAVTPARGVSWDRVVLVGQPGGAAAVRAAVTAVGGRVGVDQPLVDGVSADVPAGSEQRLQAAPGVRSVSPDARVTVAGSTWDSAATTSAFVRSTRSGAAWDGGDHGEGVGVALVDTGVSPVPDLATHLEQGPDLSGEGTGVDSFGHGTVMAGLIAGDGTSSGGAHVGLAPGARIISVKVAGADGSSDVSTVLQGLHWVSAYAKSEGIRVVNLSFGVPGTQDPRLDPLDYAVERLWRQGIVVVVSAGNSGPGASTITSPGSDPAVITVGAFDDATTAGWRDDAVPAWSSVGPTAAGTAKPDVVAPGRTVVATRAPGSTIERANPSALLDGGYITGSGTSEAAAVTSGAVALLLQDRPNLTPDQVKSLLTRTAIPVPDTLTTAQGAGRIRVGTALAAAPGPKTWQTLTATGLGSLESARGGLHVQVRCGGQTVLLTGERDTRCTPWDPTAWAAGAWRGKAWTGSSWEGSSWEGSSWEGSSWEGSSWEGSSWEGSSWEGSSWEGSSWEDAFWGATTPWYAPLPGEVAAPAPPLL